MSLDSLGNLGEFVGSLGVLVSLVYLAVQIKRNTEAERTSTYHSLVSDFGDLNRLMAADPKLSHLYVQSLEDWEALDPAERARISQIFYMSFRYFENMYYQHRKGYVDDEVWEGWERLMLNYAGRPGFRSWWDLRRDVFSEPFVRFVETTPIAHPIATYADITRRRATAEGSARA